MANYPSQLSERDELNLRLGIKSSLSQLRSVIASLYVIYVANDKQAQVTYSKESINGSLTSIKLEDNLAQQIDAKFPTAAEKISSLVNKTPLFTAQLEALQVGIELFFHLAKINFVASGLSERTGSSRFQKKLAFATNMILVDLYLSSHSNEDVNKLLAAWLEDKPFASKLEDGLKMLLNTFTEETQYKIRDNNLDEIVFNQEGVYDTVLNEGEAISKDGNEPVGPFRIYKSYVASGMHPYLIEQKQEFKLNGSVSRADLENYAQLVSTALDITPRRTTIEREVAPSIVVANTSPLNEPNQVIYFGAPGTGKSHTVQGYTKDLPEGNVFRTTFHPDSDYSTFVGSYKPTKEKRPVRNVAGDIVKQNGQEVYEDAITYNYIPQAFTKAYIRAWQTKDPVFLVIEEINRGNCAQIFGDLFQLLDRKNNISEYPIKPDHDLGSYISEQFRKFGCVASENSAIFKGDELCLPANLYIWATMNTSDQSLFPIDSAFKRRWEWRYIKIAKPIDKETGNPFDWHIEGNTDWWQFLKKINAIINKMTNSADKQLGYFFAKADDAGEIKYDRFVAKVCFYLWNDIFKTYAMDDVETDLFKYKYQDEDGQEKIGKLNFTEFFDENGKVVPGIVQQFIENVMKWNDNSKQE